VPSRSAHPIGGSPLIVAVVDAVRVAVGTPPCRDRSRGDPWSGSARRYRSLRRAGGYRSWHWRRAPQRAGLSPEWGPVLVTVGDARSSVRRRWSGCWRPMPVSPRACTLLLGVPADPAGLGRAVRDEAGHVAPHRREESAISHPVEPVPWSRQRVGILRLDVAQLWPALGPGSRPRTLRAILHAPTSSAAPPGRSRPWSAPDPDESSSSTIGVSSRPPRPHPAPDSPHAHALA